MHQDEFTNDELTIDLFKIIKECWKKAWLILLVGILLGGAMFVYETHTYVPNYQTSVTLYVKPEPQDTDPGNSIDTLAGTCIAVLNTRTALEKISSTAGLNISYDKLSTMISATQVSKSPLLQITVAGTSPEEITLIANTAAEVLPDMVSFIYATQCDIGVVDHALVPTSPIFGISTMDAVVAAVLGMMLVCGIIAVRVIYVDWKEAKEKQNAQ